MKGLEDHLISKGVGLYQSIFKINNFWLNPCKVKTIVARYVLCRCDCRKSEHIKFL